jgi:hypothetical protein
MVLKMANRPHMNLAILDELEMLSAPMGDRRVGHEDNGLISIPTDESDGACDARVVTNSFQNPGPTNQYQGQMGQWFEGGQQALHEVGHLGRA